MEGNLLGEPFDPYVLNEIKNRQNIHGSGLNSNRTSEELLYLNNRNAWIKLASSVSVEDEKRLIDIGFPPESTANYKNSKLAEEAILFNGLNSLNSISSNTQRQGVSTTNSLFPTDNKVYGIGGTNQGLQPMPGIESLSIDTLNRGSIRSATLSLKANNKFQFELIELLYLRLGYTMLVEWGWDKFINPKTNELKNVETTLAEKIWFKESGTTQLEMLEKIETQRGKYSGNYDGFMGRVTNFEWTFNPDGSYSITLKLITVGDLIESLTVKSNPNTLPTNNIVSGSSQSDRITELEITNSKIVSNKDNSALGKWIYNNITDLNWEEGFQDTEYFIIPESDPSSTQPYNNGQINPSYRYFMTLKMLLDAVQELCIPSIENKQGTLSPSLTIDTNRETNIMTTVPNHMSLDPRICMIYPEDYLVGNINSSFSDGYLDPMKKFAVKVQGKNSEGQKRIIDRYGLLYNIYLNVDFISNILASSTDSENNLSLFKFLKDICSGINAALGNVNKLEPIIKDDRVITIIDQTLNVPILKDIEEFEIFGYSKSKSKSNFVKNINFNTKITPKMATQISIGATAQSNSTKDLTATSLQKWNKGLVDRFNQTLIFNSPTDNYKSLLLSKQVEKIERLGGIWDDTSSLLEKTLTGLTNLLPSNPLSLAVLLNITSKTVKDIEYKGRVYKNITKENFIDRAITNDYLDLQKKQLEITQSLEYSKVYKKWRIKVFGDMNGATQWDIPYIKFSSTIYDEGKRAFEIYLNDYYNRKYNLNNISNNHIGFIPVELELTLDGISGIKIYQQLKIRQQFLPKNYPESLGFLITKVNHKVSNNSWETTLGTLSTSNVDSNSTDKPEEENTTIDNSNNEKLRILANRLIISENGKSFIKQHEGFRSEPYDDENPYVKLTSLSQVEGEITIGYGFTKASLGRPIKLTDRMKKEEADRLFDIYIQDYQRTVYKQFGDVPLTQGEFDALVSIVYNSGEIGNTSNGKATPLLISILDRQYETASSIIPDYRTTSNKKDNPGLRNRRKLEQDIFNS